MNSFNFFFEFIIILNDTIRITRSGRLKSYLPYRKNDTAELTGSLG
jgi:hypothetical protein